MPPTSWNRSAPERVWLLFQRESGVDHPRWSPGARAPDRRLLPRKTLAVSTAMGEVVAALYRGMNLQKILLSVTPLRAKHRKRRCTWLMALPLLGLVGQWRWSGDAAARCRPTARRAERWTHCLQHRLLSACGRCAALWLTLAMSPLRQITGWGWLATLRRPIGLWCLRLCAAAILAVYFGLDQASTLA
jgi:hypothetical protein